MKAVILAGGEGTRLRPLTLSLPKPAAPILDRPLLEYQLALLRDAGVTDVVFCLGYRPEKICETFGDGRDFGVTLRYNVEETPLGTGGAVRNAETLLDDTTVVLNGDVLADIDLTRVIADHRQRGAQATIVLTPVPDPSSFGLVETDDRGRVCRFIEKPDASQITVNTINAGLYVLQSSTLGLIPPCCNHSIERGFFPNLLARGDLVMAHVHDGYWIDIGTPAKYLQAHRDILHGRLPVDIRAEPSRGGWIASSADVASEAVLDGPFYIGPGCVVPAGARVGPDTSLVADVLLAAGAVVEGSVVWPRAHLGEHTSVQGALVGPGVVIAPHARVASGTLLGEGSCLSPYSSTSIPHAGSNR